ncbi:MAG: hemolysin family protein [Gammaproteobacteria bacterium]
MYSALLIFFILAISLSFLCSLWEAVLLSITPLYAQIKMHEETYVGKKLKQFKDNIDEPLAAILTLNTFAHTIGAIGVGEQATLIWHDSNPIITGVFVPLTMTIAILILSEIIPKTIGANYWEKLSYFTVYSLSFLLKIIYPAVWLCQLITKSLRREQNKSIFSRTDFIALTEIGEQQGILQEGESEIIEKTLDLYELRVTEVMRPISDIVTLHKGDSIDHLFNLIKQHKYTRYPVYDREKDEVIGIIHVKDLLTATKNLEKCSIDEFIRPILKVPTYLPVNDLLHRFRAGMPHFALVYDNRDKPVGFITLDNVLQVLFGIIKDEFHRTQIDWVLNDDGTISAHGFCSIYTLKRILNINIELDEDIETVAGLVLHKLGRLPKKGERVEFDYFDVLVEKLKKTRILRIKIYPKNNNL